MSQTERKREREKKEKREKRKENKKKKKKINKTGGKLLKQANNENDIADKLLLFHSCK